MPSRAAVSLSRTGELSRHVENLLGQRVCALFGRIMTDLIARWLEEFVTRSERHDKQRSNHDGGRFRIKLSRDCVPPLFTPFHTNTPSQPSHLALHFRVLFHARPLQHLSRTLKTIFSTGRKAALRFIKQKPPSSCNKLRPPTNPAFTARNF
jgi:hypothetical protein